MNRKIFTGLIVLMGVALAGIIAIQVLWLRNSIEVQNELFNRSVFDALTQSSRNLEKMKDAKTLHNIYFNGKVHSGGVPIPPKTIHRSGKQIQQNIRIHTDNDSNRIEEHIIWSRSGNDKAVKVISADSLFFDRDNEELMVDYDSVMLDLKKDIDRNIKVFIAQSTRHKQKNDSVDVTVELKGPVGSKYQYFSSVAEDLVEEVWTWNSEPYIDTLLVKDVLQKELGAIDIPISFEFGVLKDSLIKASSLEADSVALFKSDYKVKLFTGGFFDQNYWLTVYFPDRRAFVLRSLLLPASLSLIFCAVILIAFSLSIFYLLRQKKISDMKTDFINNMTHEFKTPLATIGVASDSIVNPKVIDDHEKVRYFSSMIKQENIRMNKQVETILQIAKLEKKDYQFKFETVNIHHLINESCDGMELQITRREGVLNRKLEAANPMVTTDVTHFLNVMNNLLDNANKYSSAKPRVEVRTFNSDRGVWIQVSDRGKGMSKSVQSRIFERFYRETSGNVHNVKGFGLGLSFVQAIVQANKGEIKVKSEPGKGSTFEVFIPFTLA